MQPPMRAANQEVVMYARVPTFRISPANMDAAIREFEAVTLPKLHQLDGFKGATMLVDREQGMFQVIGFWSDRKAVDATSEVAKGLREDFERKFNAEVVSVIIWEVGVDVYGKGVKETIEAAGGATRSR
jgi:hypothetical protein